MKSFLAAINKKCILSKDPEHITCTGEPVSSENVDVKKKFNIMYANWEKDAHEVFALAFTEWAVYTTDTKFGFSDDNISMNFFLLRTTNFVYFSLPIC